MSESAMPSRQSRRDGGMFQNVYVGATFSRYEEARAVMDAVTASGRTVTHDWTRTRAFGADGHPLPGTAGGYDLDPDDARAHALDDMEAVARADLLILLAQEPSLGWPIEMGMALAYGRAMIAVVAPFKWTVFLALMQVEQFATVDDALSWMQAAQEEAA